MTAPKQPWYRRAVDAGPLLSFRLPALLLLMTVFPTHTRPAVRMVYLGGEAFGKHP